MKASESPQEWENFWIDLLNEYEEVCAKLAGESDVDDADDDPEGEVIAEEEHLC